MDKARFVRSRALLGEEAMEKIYKSTVMVVGCGAVGGYAIEALARSGVGKIIVVDFDVFDVSNINRQILALTSTIGRKKAEVARERIFEINPDCEVVVMDMFVNSENLAELLKIKPDFVVDAIDSLNPKCCLIEELVKHKIPFISSMGAARKTDPTLIRIDKLNHTSVCPLARFIRRRLKRRGTDISKVNCVYSVEEANVTDYSAFGENFSVDDENLERLPLGSLPTITAIFGLLIANEAIMYLKR